MTDAGAGSADVSFSETRLEVGRIDKPHGLKGEMQVTFVTNMIEQRTALGTKLWADGRWLTVTAARPHQKKWLLTFEQVNGRNDADLLRGAVLEAEPLESESDVFVHELVGKNLIDQHGVEHGTIEAVVDNPASDLLELSGDRLVPLTFYVKNDDESVWVDVPRGLLDDDAVSDGSNDTASKQSDNPGAD